MGHVRLLAPLAASLLVLAAPPTAAAGESQVSIDSNAQFDFFGTDIDVSAQVECEGGMGTLFVTVDQQPPESPTPAHGTGDNAVVCDGQQHRVGVTVVANVGLFDVGLAFAQATLVAPSGTAQDRRTISIRVV